MSYSKPMDIITSLGTSNSTTYSSLKTSLPCAETRSRLTIEHLGLCPTENSAVGWFSCLWFILGAEKLLWTLQRPSEGACISSVSRHKAFWEVPRVRQLVLPVQATSRWRCIWRIGGKVVTGKKWKTGRKICSRAILSRHMNRPGVENVPPLWEAGDLMSHGAALQARHNLNYKYPVRTAQ